MEIIEQLKTNKLIDNPTEIQKICLHKLKSNPLPNPKSELWRLSNKSKLSKFLDYSVNEKDSKFDIPYPNNSQKSTIRIIIGENCQIKLIEKSKKFENFDLFESLHSSLLGLGRGIDCNLRRQIFCISVWL